MVILNRYISVDRQKALIWPIIATLTRYEWAITKLISMDGNRGLTVGIWRTIASSLIAVLSSSAYSLVDDVKI